MLGRDLFWWLTRLGVFTKGQHSPVASRMRARGDLVIGSPMSALRQAGVGIRPRVTAAGPHGVRFEDGSGPGPAGTAVVWATGFARDYSWIEVPGVVDGDTVLHHRGVTVVSGPAFLGLPWQHPRLVAPRLRPARRRLAGRPAADRHASDGPRTIGHAAVTRLSDAEP